ncbi:MAG: flavodoxin domain-containing protein [Candidatus Hodarchaeales archaeon]
MIEKRILIVYGSRFGSTEEIAKKISEIIEEKGIRTKIVNLRKTTEKEWPDLNYYDGIIIGTGIKIGRWTKEVKKFITKNKNLINQSKKPSGFFISSGLASFEETYEQAKEDFIVKKFTQMGIEISYFDAFGGVIDLSETSNKGWLDKKMLRTIFKDNPKINLKTRNDLRDWEKIQEFAERFVKM